MKASYAIRLGHTIAVADLSLVGGKTYELNRINVPAQYRRKGYGTALMQMLLADADAEKVTIRLTINSYGEMTEPQLRAWYTSYGWLTNLDGSMVRPPKYRAPEAQGE